jgi:hypothetical protein
MTTIADHSMASGLFSQVDRHAHAHSTRPAQAEHEARLVQGVSRWSAPPPAPSRNWNYLLQLGLLVAVLLIVFGVRMVG